jgi:phosphate transport system substrate-binding protein
MSPSSHRIVSTALAAIAVLASACKEQKPQAPAATQAQDLRADGALVNVQPAQGRPAPTPGAEPPAAPAAPAAPMPAAEAAVRAAGAALYSPASEYTKEISDIVAGFPAYASKPGIPATSLTIRGSDTMGPFLANAITRFESIYPSIRFTLHTGGTERGLASLLKGEIQVAAIAGTVTDAQRAAIESASGMRLFVVPVAMDAVCVFVNADNPLASMTKAQCNGLFSITHSMVPQPILRWNEIDPSSPLGDEFPPLYLTDVSSGTLRSFTEWCMPGEEITTILRFNEPGPASVVNACCAYRAAIGVAGYGMRQARARAIALEAGDGRPPVAPTATTIRDRSYPLTRMLNLAFLAKDPASVDPTLVQFLRFLWSEDGQDVAATVNIVPPTLDLMPVDVIGTPTLDVWK